MVEQPVCEHLSSAPHSRVLLAENPGAGRPEHAESFRRIGATRGELENGRRARASGEGVGGVPRWTIWSAGESEVSGSPVAVGKRATRSSPVPGFGEGSRPQARGQHSVTQPAQTMNKVVRYVLLAEVFAVATFAVGWWAVPVVAALWGFFSRDPKRPRNVAVAAAGGWATLLVLDAVRGPVYVMASQLGDVMSIPPFVLYLVTLLFPALLAWAAATLVRRPDATTREAVRSEVS